MIRVQNEVSLSVSDFDGDFEECQNAIDKATEILKEELKGIFFQEDQEKCYKIIKVEFIEFDSSNPGHAAAYFLCDVEVDPQLLWNNAYTMWCDLEAKGGRG